MRALPTDGDVRAYGHVAHRKQRRCKDPRSSSLYRSLPLAFSWARAMGHVAYPSRDQSAQAFPVNRFYGVITSPANQNAHVTGKAWDRGYLIPTTCSLWEHYTSAAQRIATLWVAPARPQCRSIMLVFLKDFLLVQLSLDYIDYQQDSVVGENPPSKLRGQFPTGSDTDRVRLARCVKTVETDTVFPQSLVSCEPTARRINFLRSVVCEIRRCPRDAVR